MYDKDFVKRAITSPFVSFLTEDTVRQELIDGYKYGVRSAIISPGQCDIINDIKEKYDNGYTRTGMVVGYPYGGISTNMKVYLTKLAKDKELDEVDVGFNVTAAASGDFDTVGEELERVLDASSGKVDIVPMLWMVKFPFEIVDELCRLYVNLGVKSVKTSAGIHFGRMQIEHIDWLNKNWGDKLSIEVAGKVRSREVAEAMFAAGASFIHLGSWRRLSGIGQDLQFDFNTKEVYYGDYKEAEK